MTERDKISFIHHHDRKHQKHICWYSFSLGAVASPVSIIAGMALAVIIFEEFLGQ